MIAPWIEFRDAPVPGRVLAQREIHGVLSADGPREALRFGERLVIHVNSGQRHSCLLVIVRRSPSSHRGPTNQTSDPELVIAEFDYNLRYADRTTTSANVQVMRIRDGLIVESRDYHDHLRFAALAGRAERLADACQQELS